MIVAGGGIGSFTTFSTWILDSHRLADAGHTHLVWLNLGLSLVAGFAAVALGHWLGGAGSSAASARPPLSLPCKKDEERHAGRPRVALPRPAVEQPPPTEAPAGARVPLRELEDGQRVGGVFAVRERELRRKRNGEPWLRLALGDASGSAEAVAWEDAEALYALAAPGPRSSSAAPSRSASAGGRRSSSPGCARPRRASTSPRTSPPSRTSPSSISRASCASCWRRSRSRQLRDLLDRFFGERSPIWARFRDAPAAKVYHQAYRHGLLEHTVSVAQAVSAAANFFPGIDREVAVAGALLHDIGKTEAYNDDPLAIDLTDAGRLQGEIPLGYYMVRREIEEIPGFDPALAQAVLHIILSHHGSLEHGSPVVPATREAVLVHMIDNLGGRLGSFDRLERELPAGESWSSFDRALSGSAYFGQRAAA